MQSGQCSFVDIIAPMRFPLIVLVLYVHSLGFEASPVTLSLDGWNVFRFFSEMISHNLGTIAICCFYLFSGYLFFYGGISVDYRYFLGKWRNRIYSLLIPYLLWNLFFILLGFLRNRAFVGLLGVDSTMPKFGQLDLVRWFVTGPVDYPLYFVRDLIIMSIAAPIWYYLTKLSKWTSLAVIAAFYISPIGLPIPGKMAIVFFCLGAWLSIWKSDVLGLCQKVKMPSYLFAILLAIACPILNQWLFYGYLLRASILIWMVAFVNIVSAILRNDKLSMSLTKLSKTVFFIYAAHELFILGWTKGLMERLFGSGLAAMWIRYIFVPIIVLLACLGFYAVLNKVTPRVLAFACGGRTIKK